MEEKEKNEITEEERKEKEKTKKSNKKNNKEKNSTEEKDNNSENKKEIAEEKEDETENEEGQDDDVVWSVGIEDDGNVHVRPIKKEEETEEFDENEITEEEVKAVAEAIIEESKNSKRSIQSIVKELAGVEEVEEKIETPKGFTKKQELNKKEYGYHNGRKYLKLKNGFGMWADNGQSFSIDDLD